MSWNAINKRLRERKKGKSAVLCIKHMYKKGDMFLMNWYQFFNTTACMLVYVCGSKSESLKSGCRHDKRSALAAHKNYYRLRCIAWNKKNTHTARRKKSGRSCNECCGRKTATCECVSVPRCRSKNDSLNLFWVYCVSLEPTADNVTHPRSQ